MAGEPAQRRLVAILAADVVGYSRMMGTDEVGTLAALKGWYKDTLQPLLTKHKGRVVKLMGDGVLAEFASAVNAVECAVEMQASMVAAENGAPEAQRLILRIGINLGDVIVEGDDLYGDGVNVAARLEAMALPGGICISDDTYRQVRDKLDIAFEDAGEHRLKNIARPLRIYRVSFGSGHSAPHPGLALPDKPSIAVLPFRNMSGDPEQEYFADGMVEEIIMAMSRLHWLFVIARNSSFAYKGQAVDVRQVGRELGVRYVLEGSVRKGGSNLRIMGNLVDASTGAHLWADRFDGTIENVFDLQDQVTVSVVGAIAPRLEQAEIERALRKPTGSLDAYDFYLRGMAHFYLGNRDAIEEGLSLFYKAIERDPDFASAYAMAAWCHVWRKVNGWMQDREQEIAEGARLGHLALERGRNDAVALARGGHALAHFVGDLDSCIALVDKALALDPNLSTAWFLGGYLRTERGDADKAIDYFARAMRISPLDPELFRMQTGMALAHLLAGRFDDASSWAEKARRVMPNFLLVVAVLAASHALAGRPEEAQKAASHLRQLDPRFRVSALADLVPIHRPQDLASFAKGLKQAGLPE